MRYQIVVFDANISAKEPEDFLNILPGISVGSIFYHFIDARRRNQNSLDDFQNWLIDFGGKYEDLCKMISDICPYFTPLSNLREELGEVFTNYFQRA